MKYGTSSIFSVSSILILSLCLAPAELSAAQEKTKGRWATMKEKIRAMKDQASEWIEKNTETALIIGIVSAVVCYSAYKKMYPQRPHNYDDGCPICLEKFDQQNITILPCNHGFHHDCINTWVETCKKGEHHAGHYLFGIIHIKADPRHAECPLCRKKI